MAQVAEAQRKQELIDIKRNAGVLKQGMMEVGSASFKIAQVGSKMAGEEMRKAAETHGPAIKHHSERIGQDFNNLRRQETIVNGEVWEHPGTIDQGYV